MAKYKYTISKSKEIDNLLKKKVSEILDIVGEDVVQKLKEYIKKYWYDTYSPECYKRTGNLINSVKYEKSRSYVYIYIDEYELGSAVNFSEPWNTHAGFDAEVFGAGLMEFIENGRYDSGKIGSKSNPRIGYSAKVIRRLNTWLKRYVDNEIKRRIRMVIFSKK